VLDLLLPQRCLACGRTGEPVCRACLDALPRLQPPFCDRCGAPTAWPVRRCAECAGRRLAFASARAAVAYDERVRRIVAGWKEHGLRRLATTAADLVVEVLAPPAVDAITFVPPDRERRLKRGHHPSERLARELAERWDIPVLVALARSGRSSRQRGLDIAARKRNVRGAFNAPKRVPARLCLVDDVFTSGATASAAASALRAQGASQVHAITLARTLRLR
jgi:predicted amidophosphoribosyltransferase